MVTIVNSSGSPVVNYTYNAWGKLCRTTGSMASTLGTYNPLRYRGYVYDTDTGLYYLQSRYYNPEMGRFINADSYASTGQGIIGNNMFAYCNNNPVNMADKTGTWPSWVAKAVTVVAIGVAVVAATAVALSTFGVGSIASIAMVTATATLAARTFEVAALQVKKGMEEGKESDQIAKDTVEAIYDNGLKIIGLTPITKSAGIMFRHSLESIVEKGFGGTQTLNAALQSTGGRIIPYFFVGVAVLHTTISVFSDDPVERANERGYVLK